MTYSRTSITKILSTVVITCAVAAFYAAPVAAQTATNLNCGGCVKSKQIKNGGVKNKDLKDDAVNGQKIADGTVGNPDIAGDAVTSDKILDGTVTGADVLDESLTGADVQNNSLTGADVQNSSLTGSDVQDNSLNSADVALLNRGDISDEAGADSAGGNQTFNLIAFPFTMRSVIISAPSAGRVIVNASGTFRFNSAGFDAVLCSITNGAILVDGNNQITASEYNSAHNLNHVPFAGTRGFTVGPGATTFRLVCKETAGNVQVQDSQITAIFVPTTY